MTEGMSANNSTPLSKAQPRPLGATRTMNREARMDTGTDITRDSRVA